MTDVAPPAPGVATEVPVDAPEPKSEPEVSEEPTKPPSAEEMGLGDAPVERPTRGVSDSVGSKSGEREPTEMGAEVA